jgi:hypothetical protein
MAHNESDDKMKQVQPEQEKFDPSDPHTDAPNFGEEGGSSQWGQRVLTSEGPKKRVVTRDREPSDRRER